MKLRSTSFKQRTTEWDTSTENLSLNEDTAKLAAPVLEAQLTRALETIERTDTKAALVIPAIGIVAGVVAPALRASVEELHLIALAVVIAVGTLASAFAAIWAIRPRSRSNGPDALKVLQGSGVEEAAAREAYLKSLGFAVTSSEEVALVKANWLILSLAAGVVAVMALIGYLATGGLA